MVNADLMDAIDRSLRQARGRRAEPFGGVQIVMFGDPYQLAPVPPRGDELRYIRDHYRSFWFFDAQGVGGADAAIASASALDGFAELGPFGAELQHPRARRHPPAGRSRVQGDAQRGAARARDGRDRAAAQRHGRAHSARAGRRRDPDHHPRDPQRHRQHHQPPAPRRARRARADGDRRDQRRLRARGCRVPGRCRAEAEGRRAGDVPAQRHRRRSASRRAGSTARSAR